MYPSLPQRIQRRQERNRESYRQDYYTGLPSCPMFVGSSENWTPIYPVPSKSLMAMVSPELSAAGWEDNVRYQFEAHLLKEGQDWSSLDPVCMTSAYNCVPPIKMIWVGVPDGSLLIPQDKGEKLAMALKGILTSHGITDIIVQIRESVVFDLAPRLIAPSTTPIDDFDTVLNAFSTTVGIPIVEISKARGGGYGGTGGLFVVDEEDPSQLYIATCRHVIAKPLVQENKLIRYPVVSSHSEDPSLVAFCSQKKYTEISADLKVASTSSAASLQWAESGVDVFGENPTGMEAVRKARHQKVVKDLKLIVPLLSNLEKDYESCAKVEERIIGEVALSPPLAQNVREEDEISEDTIPSKRQLVDGFTEDWALIRVYKDVIGSHNFKGNQLFLGRSLTETDFHTYMGSDATFPTNKIIEYKRLLPKGELQKLSGLQGGKTGLAVVTDGLVSGVTFGRTSGFLSVTRRKHWKNNDGTGVQVDCQSLEIAVYGRSKAYFSKTGDSGSSVVDADGNLIGILTGGSGNPNKAASDPDSGTDITYVSDIHFIKARMKRLGFHPNFFPIASDLEPHRLSSCTVTEV